MKFRYSNPLKLFVRVVVVAFVCSLLLFSNTPSAFAFWGNNPAKGEESLPNIQDKAEQVIKSNSSDLNKSSRKSKQEFNEVQGKADLDKMKHSDEKLPIVRDVEQALKKAHANTGDAVEATVEKAGIAINSLKDDAGNTVDSAIKKTGNAINSLKDNAGNTVDSAVKKTGNAMNSLKDDAGNTVDSLKSKAGNKIDDLKNKMKS